MNNTIAKGGQIGAIAWKNKEVVKLFEYFCLMHSVYDPERSGLGVRGTKLQPIKMEQVIIKQDINEGEKIEYFKSCPKCHQIIKEGEYIKNE